jgi:hypothetical protein
MVTHMGGSRHHRERIRGPMGGGTVAYCPSLCILRDINPWRSTGISAAQDRT